MNYPTICGKKTLAMAGAILLCGSMGMAQTTSAAQEARRPRTRALTLA